MIEEAFLLLVTSCGKEEDAVGLFHRLQLVYSWMLQCVLQRLRGYRAT